MIVAIDGPAGAGKSTVARKLAERLGFSYLDTGAMYRALTWLAIREALPLGEGDALGDLARRNPVTFDDVGRVFIADTDVTSAIRQSRIDRMVPVVARHHDVREVMRERQRELGHQGNVVIEGRDIGTVVAPDAEVKVYLHADPAIRAARRQAERPDIGADALATDLRIRDESDRVRMQPAEDAELIDTTDLEVDDVVSRIEELIRVRSSGSAVTLQDVDLGPRPCLHGPAGALGDARPCLRARARACDRRARLRGQPHALARHPDRRRAVAAQRQLRREGRGARVSRARAVPGLARDDRRAARRVRPRRGAVDAGDGARGRRRRPVRRGDPSEAGAAGSGSAGCSDGRGPGGGAGGPDRDLRHAVLEGRRLRSVLDRVRRAGAVRGVPKGGRGYKEATAEIERRINVLFDWLAEVHAKGRPAGLTPPL